MDQGILAPFLLQMVLGAVQGRLLGSAFALRKRLCRLLSGSTEPTDEDVAAEPPPASKIASWVLTALLVPLPGLAWYFWLVDPDPKQYSPVFALFLIAFFFATPGERHGI